MALIEIKNLTKKFKVKQRWKPYMLMAVNDVSLKIEEGKCIGLVGESGCGKTTLGKLISRLEKPSGGDVLLEGKSIYGKRSDGERKKFAKDIQMVFQDSFDAVDPRYTANDIIREPLDNLTNMTESEKDERIEDLMELVGVAIREKYKFAMEFSGGQLQRICIARALASNPRVMIMDEPLSSLDVSVQAQILNLFGDIKRKMNMTSLFISHDLEAVYYLADSLAVMYGGRIMEIIDDINMLKQMKHPYTRLLFHSIFKDKDNREAEKTAEEAEIIWIDQMIQKAGYTGCPFRNRCAWRTESCNEEIPLREIGKGHFAACHRLGG